MPFTALETLRGRYLAVAILLTLIVLAGAFFADRNVSSARYESTANIELRSQLLVESRHARDAVWKAREALEMFLLAPENSEHQKHVHSHIGEAIEHTSALMKHPWIVDQGRLANVQQLGQSLHKLDLETENLIRTRTDPTRQYPGLAFAREIMHPHGVEFTTLAQLALDEIVAEDPQGSGAPAYRAFVAVRHSWTQMLSLFRLYLANRIGSFQETALLRQEGDIDNQYRELQSQLAGLSDLGKQGHLGFQGRDSLERMLAAASAWNDAYQKIKQIHASGEWRADKKLIDEAILPLLEEIWNLLLSLDITIEASANEDVSTLTKVAQSQTGMVWLFTLLALVLIVFGSFALQRLVLSPIATVAAALKAEALGGGQSPLLTTSAKETRDLVDAFAEMRKQVHIRQDALEHQAMHDALTDLPNRILLLDRLQQVTYAAARHDGAVALLMMDLDRFKEINDTLGHQVGDQLLKEIGKRLLGTLRKSDTVARLGGDEFAILLPATDIEEAKRIAAKARAALEQVVLVDGHPLYVSASIGISAFPKHGTTAQSLIQRADVAMYVAKRNRTAFAVYDPDEDQHSIGRLALITDLREALDSNGLELNYQPKLEIRGSKVVGVEALLRWTHPEFGPIPPDQIVALAEQTGLIKPLTLWVLDQALQQCRAWQLRDLHLNVAVNLSVYNLQDADFAEQVSDCLARYDVNPKCLALEITESAMMANPQHAVNTLTRLDTMGVRLSVDDFGTGFSSLAYLKQLPVDELKIDKSFVIDMTEDDNDAVIVRSIIDLSHNLGLKVVAEGVETREIWDLLEILRCDAAQGYLISRPLSALELEEWLHEKGQERVAHTANA